jgi:hypothetical protein
MTTIYVSIAHKDIADTGYGFAGYVDLAQRTDGNRYRMTIAGFRWYSDCEGGLSENPRYGPISEARAFWVEHFEEGSPLTESEFFAQQFG